LLEETVQLIENSDAKVMLYKVKGHSHLIGNEKADEIAQAVAKGEITEESCKELAAASNDRGTRYWPYKVRIRESSGRKLSRPVVDLKEAIKSQCHEHCKLGMANRQTIYFEAFQKIEGRCVGTASNAFMTSTKITYAEKKIALAYRYGVMWTRKRAFRCGYAPDSSCVLCGQEDGGHHTASGCPQLKEQYIKRHNKIGRVMMTRILRGRRGAFVIQMDLGSEQRCAEDGIAYHPRCLPWQKLPRGLKELLEARQGSCNKRPDGLLYKPARGDRPAEFWIVEIKICKDTDPDPAYDRALSQHQELIESIKITLPNARVNYVPLLVGVTGTIYHATATFLEELGVKSSAHNQCLTDLNVAAVKALHEIYKAKRAQECKWEKRHPKRASS
jgi:hypothetical protein